jgi:hypothetical protein
LNKDILNKNLLHGGVSLNKSELTLNNLQKRFPFVVLNNRSMEIIKGLEDVFKKGIKPKKLFCLQGISTGPINTVLQTLLATCINAGKTVKQANLQDIISTQFSNNGVAEDLKNIDIYSLSFGNELQYNVAESIIDDTIRNCALTKTYLMLNTTLNYSALSSKYSSGFLKLFVRNGIDTIFENDRRIIYVGLEV